MIENESSRSSLADSFGRRISYLRVSVTDRCNYRCFYCAPPEGIRGTPHREVLRHEETARIVRVFAGMGVENVRLTGGEPLVRRNVLELVRMIAAVPGIRDVALSTNAHLLAGQAGALKAAGLSRVNISLDTLEPETFRCITGGGGDLERVLAGVDAALAAELTPVKLNMVVMRGINDHEIERMVEFAVARGADLRVIETMPIGGPGNDRTDHYYPVSSILERVQRHFGGELVPVSPGRGAGPARYFQVGDGPVRIGVISAMSRHFCDTCNRVRLTARGDLVFCLGKDDFVPLRDGLRAGWSDEDLELRIREAMLRKPMQHDFGKPGQAPRHAMSTLGG